jgi:hypothetical protein
LTFNDEEGKVVKSARRGKYPLKRFTSQIEKQQRFFKEHIGECVYKTPYVFGIHRTNQYAHAFMELIDGRDPIEFFQNNSDRQCIRLFQSIVGLVNEYFSNAEYNEIDVGIVHRKYNSVVEKLPEEQRTWVDMAWLDKFAPPDDTLVLPTGDCHGDLTLSNMIIREHDLVVLDFMDTYLDSPLQDICKLRQDTTHHWTLLRYPGTIYKRKRLLNRLQALDQYIVLEWPRMYDWQYKTFQFLNLIRILPYATDPKVHNWVYQEIGKIA